LKALSFRSSNSSTFYKAHVKWIVLPPQIKICYSIIAKYTDLDHKILPEWRKSH